MKNKNYWWLAFCRDCKNISESSNGNFLSILELLDNKLSVLNEHLNTISHFQNKEEKIACV